MPRVLFVAYIIIFFNVALHAQLYHYETGKALGLGDANQIIWKEGVFNNYPAKYGTLVVKENRNNRNSRLINIPVIQIKAINPKDSLPPIFLLHGGPGESNLQNHLFFDDLAANQDIVLVGYRGVDGSVKLDCQCLGNGLLSDSLTLENADQLFNEAFDSCLNEYKLQKIDVNGYSMDEVIDDIDITRQILQYDSISILSFSYGTMLSQLYAQKYPQNTAKSIMVAPRPLNKFYFEGNVYEKQIYDLYSKYMKDNSQEGRDSMAMVLETIDTLLNSILEDNKELNPYRFYFFGFSKLYVIQDIEKLFNAYLEAYKGNADELLKLYNDFYKNFPNDLVIGDMIVKKQNRVAFEEYKIDNGIGSKITATINTFYTPQNNLLASTNVDSIKSMELPSSKTTMIFGEYDIAAPSNYFTNFDSTNVIVVPDAGHLDLFYAKRKNVRQLILDIFYN